MGIFYLLITQNDPLILLGILVTIYATAVIMKIEELCKKTLSWIRSKKKRT